MACGGRAEVLAAVTSPAVQVAAWAGAVAAEMQTSGDVQSVWEVELLTLWVGWTGGVT